MREADFFEDVFDEGIVDFGDVFDTGTSPVMLSMPGKTIGGECELHALAEGPCPINVIDNHISSYSCSRKGAFCLSERENLDKRWTDCPESCIMQEEE